MNVAIPILRSQYLDAGSTQITSESVPMQGNKCVLSVTILNVKGSPTVSLKMQGSYDGRSWEDVGTAIADNTFGQYSESEGAIDFAFMRISGSSSGASTALLFDATLAMSEQ